MEKIACLPAGRNTFGITKNTLGVAKITFGVFDNTFGECTATLRPLGHAEIAETAEIDYAIFDIEGHYIQLRLTKPRYSCY